MANRSDRLGPAERAVYELVERGAIDAAHAGLYRRPLLALARAGLVRRDDDGAYTAVQAKGDKRASTPPPAAPVSVPPPPEAPPMQTLVVRVPVAMLEALDAMGPTRSEAARLVLARALAARSGQRMRAG
jgi:hypothetical protein